MMNLVQGDCKCGALAFVAGENLSAATGLLVKLSSAGKAVKPSAVSDITPYVVAIGAFEGYLCGVMPLTSAANCRIVLKGACQVGALLVSAGDGRVEAGTLSGSSVPVGVAEEAGVDGQRLLLRPLSVGAKGEAGAPGAAGVAGAAGPAGADGATGPAGLDGDIFFVAATEVGETFGPALGAVIEYRSSDSAWHGNVSGSEALYVALIVGTAENGGATYFKCVLLFLVSDYLFRLARVPAALVSGTVEPHGYVRVAQDGSQECRTQLTTGSGTVFTSTVLRVFSVGNGYATLYPFADV